MARPRSADGERLADGEGRPAAAPSAGRLGVHEFNPGAKTIKWDTTTRSLWGVSPDEPITCDTFAAGIHPDDRAATQATIDAALKAGGPGSYEAIFRVVHRETKDARWVRANGVVTFEDGATVKLVGTVRDITDQKQSEAALRESERRFRRLVESMPQLVWTSAADGSCDYLSPQWVLYTGKSEAEQLGYGWLAQLHPDDRERVMAHWQASVASGESYQSEFRIRRHDGTYRWFRTLGVPLRDQAGHVDRWFGSNTDIHDIKEAEEALRRQAEMLQLSFDAIIVWRLDDGIESWNRGAEELYGYSRDEAIGRVTHELLQTVHPAPWREIESEMLRAGLWEGELRHRAKDGRGVVVSARLQLVQNADGVARVLETNRDITERKEAAEASRESHARLRLALKVGKIGSFDWDVRTDTASYTEEYVAMHGLPPGTVAEPSETWLLRVHPDDRGRTLALRDVHAKDPPTDIEYRIIRPSDGAVRWIAERREIFRDDGGRPFRVVGAQFDVTEQREAEAVLARDKSELERLVAERTRDLQESHARIAHLQRMEALGQLAGGIAHDFNNVLQAMQGGASLIERRAADPVAVRRIARQIADAGGRGASITRRLLNFSRRADLRAEVIDPGQLLGELREILTHTLGAGIGVRVDLAPGVAPLLADKGQLETMLINLAANSRDAMSGSGVLTFAAAPDRLPKTTEPRPPVELRAGRYVRLSVTDTGAGMDSETLARVTEPFFTTKPMGTGLGLAMARGFIEQSGGALLIESELGRGTIMHVWLPAADSAPTAAASLERMAPPQQAGNGRVLVVDDEPLVREIVSEQLRSSGYVVTAVGDPREALALMDAGQSFDLIVSDLSMPGMDGMALVREVHRRAPSLPAILMTGYATNAAEIALGGILPGTFSLLRKPVAQDDLVERVAMLLEGAAAKTQSGLPRSV
ncbi:MAG: PAS domain-containing protein [Hyphomicrobiales bacterium]|nr:PAS domain-containing protein [Hyphomicrobiales bacterium]